MWAYLVIGFAIGLVAGFMGCSLATVSKQREYEDKLWEVEKMKARLERKIHENREW